MWPNGEILFCDRAILCRDIVGQAGKIFVATELAMTENSAAHDKAGCAKASTHNSVVTCYVMTKEAMRVRQRRPCARNRLGQACATDQIRQAQQARPGSRDRPS